MVHKASAAGQCKAIFLDRDGTINEDTDYAHNPKEYRRLPNVAEGLRAMKKMGFVLIVLTNQSGIARGIHTEEEMREFHDRIIEDLEAEGVRIDAFYFCPHHPVDPCACRKPGTGMIDAAATAFSIDVSRSYVIGDKDTDIELAKAAGCPGIFVKTGKHKNLQNASPDYAAQDLADAARWISQREASR